MKCPFCNAPDTKVTDSRATRDGEIIRRRRECERCSRRFTTYERIEESFPLVIKKDGRREMYNRDKLAGGIKRACEKRHIVVAAIDAIVDRLEHLLQDRGEKEVPSSFLGEQAMKELSQLDEVAYVRFASVYRQFRDLSQFMEELTGLLREKERGKEPDGPKDSLSEPAKEALWT